MDLYTLLGKCKIPFNKNKIKNHEIKLVSDNSKKTNTDGIFVAIKGEVHDGHDYIFACVKQKVKTIIYDDLYYDYLCFPNTNMIRVHDTKKVLSLLANYYYKEASLNVNLIAATGTNGKTTVTTLIYNMFCLLNEKCSIIGTNEIKIAEDNFISKNTTPGALMIHKLIYKSLQKEIKNVVMEVSSHALKQQRISQLDFDTIIYTNFSHDHLDYHKTFDDYFYSKALLFNCLGNYLNDKKVLFNGDDNHYKKFMALTNVEYYTYGIGSHNDFQARNIICDVDYISFHYYCFNEFIGIVNTNNIFGFFNVYNLLACISYFYINHYNMDEIFNIMPQLNGVKGRMQKVINPFGINVFIDFAHSPDSVYRILKEIKIISKKRIITVIGCGGNRDPLKRPLIGKITTNLCDFVIFTSDNPRYENPNFIIKEIVKGAVRNNYKMIENREDAIKYAINFIKKDDIVVILGKGHEDYQIINGNKHHFNDYDTASYYINYYFNKGE